MSVGDVNLCLHSGAAISSLHLLQKYTNRYVESWRIYSVFLGDKGPFFNMRRESGFASCYVYR